MPQSPLRVSWSATAPKLAEAARVFGSLAAWCCWVCTGAQQLAVVEDAICVLPSTRAAHAPPRDSECLPIGYGLGAVVACRPSTTTTSASPDSAAAGDTTHGGRGVVFPDWFEPHARSRLAFGVAPVAPTGLSFSFSQDASMVLARTCCCCSALGDAAIPKAALVVYDLLLSGLG